MKVCVAVNGNRTESIINREEKEKLLGLPEYQFLKTYPDLKEGILLLGLSGSRAYGTNVSDSDVDVRGIVYNTKESILGLRHFEQMVDEDTDTSIGFLSRKDGLKKAMAEITKVAIFVAASIPDVPEGCPSDYVLVNYSNRKAFAEWLQENGKQYLLKETAGSSLYHYQRGRYDFYIGIVPVDLTRPWMIGIYAGKERICYLDRIDENNQVIPDVQMFKGCVGFGFDSCVE